MCTGGSAGAWQEGQSFPLFADLRPTRTRKTNHEESRATSRDDCTTFAISAFDGNAGFRWSVLGAPDAYAFRDIDCLRIEWGSPTDVIPRLSARVDDISM
jgi:hypothetical protein